MSRIKFFYALFIVFAGLIIYFSLSHGKQKLAYTLLDRNNYISNSAEWTNTKSAIQKLLSDLRNNPDNYETKINLALAYIQESRVTGNHSYYDAAALQLADDILDKNKNDFQALCAKATIQLSQHHFAEALQTGKIAIEVNPHNSFGYGVMTDANVELGKYDEAIKYADKMVSIRPDIRSYSRVSYLREIFGDVPGAIEAMKLAVSSGVPGAEQTEWTRVYLGHLYEISGHPDTASMLFQISLYHRPNFAYAYAGLGRISKAEKKYSEAIKYFDNAKVILPDYSFNEEQAEIYRAISDPENTNKQLQNALDKLVVQKNDENSSTHGHYADRELALLYLKAYRYDLALEHALTEYNRRPDNIDVNQTLAWVRYWRGEYADANKKIDIALRTGSKNPTLLLQAGLIKIKSGNTSEGKKLINQSLAISNCSDPVLNFEIEKAIGPKTLLTNNTY